MNRYSTYYRLLRYSRPYRVRLFIGVISGFVSGGSLFGVLHFLPKLVEVVEGEGGSLQELGYAGELIDRLHLLQYVPKSDTWQFLVASIVFVNFFFLLKTTFTFLNRYMMRWVGGRILVDLRDHLFSNLQSQSLAYYGQEDVGNLIARCVNDTSAVERAVADSIADLSRAPIELVALTAAVVVASAQQHMVFLPIAIFIVMPLVVLPILLLGRRIKNYSRRAMQKISDLVSRMHETFTGIKVVKAFHTEAYEQNRFAQINYRYFKQVMKGVRAEIMMTPLMEFVAALLICVLLGYCYANGIRFSQIVPLLAASVMAYDPIKRLAKVNAYLQRSLASAERIFQILDTDTSLVEKPDPVVLTSFDNEIVFDRVSFSYEADGKPTVSDISLEIPKGKVVAFVGETGSGKSTLANLLARFYDVTDGAVRIDGHDVRDLQIAGLRQLIGIVTQEVILFNDTIANNIAYGSPDATREQIMEAARQANAHEFIMSDPKGYERIAGEKGCNLSGGQRQRISIARAILRNPQILILDEAMSALDTVTEQLIQEALTTLMQNRTVFAIAHRLSTIRHAYRIFVIENGRIVESGSHDELVAAGGKYAMLYEMQFA